MRIRVYNPKEITLLAKDAVGRNFIEIECEDADQWEDDKEPKTD